MTQTAVCNQHHSVELQLCRWLLLSLDRLAGSELNMTQERIANMLGVRREGVTENAGNLQRAGLIRYSPGAYSGIRPAGARMCRVRVLRRRQEGIRSPAQRHTLQQRTENLLTRLVHMQVQW